MKLFPDEFEMVMLGGGLFVFSVVIAIYGVIRFRSVSQGLKEISLPHLPEDDQSTK